MEFLIHRLRQGCHGHHTAKNNILPQQSVDHGLHDGIGVDRWIIDRAGHRDRDHVALITYMERIRIFLIAMINVIPLYIFGMKDGQLIGCNDLFKDHHAGGVESLHGKPDHHIRERVSR